MADQKDPAVRVRMYRQGLGDCFLVTIGGAEGGRAEEPPFQMMIDCGVILGTPDAAERLRAVVTSVIEETGGRLDVLVVTHEHYDHVAGFLLAGDLFAAPEEAGAAGKLSVDEVWFAWTEDPGNALANALRTERASQIRALTAMALRLGATEESEPGLARALAFLGVDPSGKGLGDTARAMRAAAAFAPPGRVRYLQPGAVLAPLAETRPDGKTPRFRVLGPPMDRAALRRTDSTREVYQVDAGDLAAAVALAAGEETDQAGTTSPFGKGWGLPLAGLEASPDPRAKFFRDRYLDDPAGGPAGKKDRAWRRIDGAWLASAGALALALDGATNNTSLVLALELPSGKVLLFAADAQVGNWLSWDDLSWPEPGGAVTPKDLLGRAVFYKVGHHGSHNATLRARGLERMPAGTLVSFLPVDHEMAVKKHWDAMPLPGLVAALDARCAGKVARIDAEPPEIPGLSKGGAPVKGAAYGSLYVDWTLPASP